jgi:anti-sigma factor (TIGR02949 family)
MAEEIRDCGVIEAHLTPFVDGEESPSMRESMTAHLAACPPCRTHADAESSARETIHAHRADLRTAAPDALRSRCAKLSGLGVRKSFVRRWMPLSLAATVVLAVSAAFLYGVNNPVEALAASLAIDHTACFMMTSPDPTTDRATAAAGWQQSKGWQIQIPAGLPDEQLQLVGVRDCASTDGKAAHVMYTYRGKPLSLYILPKDEGHSGTSSLLGRDAVVWCAKGRTYAVVADGHPQDLNRIVDYMKANAQ